MLDELGRETALPGTGLRFYEDYEDGNYGQMFDRRVNPELRRRGIGKILFGIAEMHLRAMGKPHAWLSTYKPQEFHNFLVSQGYRRVNSAPGELPAHYLKEFSKNGRAHPTFNLNRFTRIPVIHNGVPSMIIAGRKLVDRIS